MLPISFQRCYEMFHTSITIILFNDADRVAASRPGRTEAGSGVGVPGAGLGGLTRLLDAPYGVATVYRTTQTDTEMISAHRGMLSATARAMPRAGMKAIFFI